MVVIKNTAEGKNILGRKGHGKVMKIYFEDDKIRMYVRIANKWKQQKKDASGCSKVA